MWWRGQAWSAVRAFCACERGGAAHPARLVSVQVVGRHLRRVRAMVRVRVRVRVKVRVRVRVLGPGCCTTPICALTLNP